MLLDMKFMNEKRRSQRNKTIDDGNYKSNNKAQSKPGQRVENIESRKFMKQEKMFFVFLFRFRILIFLCFFYQLCGL
jgi:hypothetical protein